MITKLSLSVAVFFIAIWNVQCQKKSNKGDNSALALDPAVKYGKLDNGFTYYLRNNGSETTKLYLVVKAGVYHEDEDQLEYAHLLEHAGARETKHFSNLYDSFDNSFRYHHAGTTNEQTFYFASVPSDDKEGLKDGIQLLRDWAQDISLGEALSIERGAVLGEMRENDLHEAWRFNTIENVLLKNTGYKLPASEKYVSNIKNFNREALVRFYRDWYRPDLEAAIIIGDIDVDSVEMKVQRLFSDLKMNKSPKNAQERVDQQMIRLQGENQYVQIPDTVNTDFRVSIFSKGHNRAFVIKTKADFRTMLLQKIYKEIVGKRGNLLEEQYDPPFSGFTTNYRGNSVGGGQLTVTYMDFQINSDNLSVLKEKFQKAVSVWEGIHSGFTISELNQAKEKMYNDYSVSQVKNSNQLARRYMAHFVKGAAAPSPELELKLITELMDQITLSEVQSFALEQGNLTKNTDFVFFNGKEAKIPGIKTIEKWITEIKRKETVPIPVIKTKITSLSDVVEIPIPDDTGFIEKSENLIGISTITLKNGIKLVLKPTEPESEAFINKISIRAFRPNPVPFENREEYPIASIAPEVIKFMGAGPYSKFELERFMQEKGLRLNFEVNKDAQIISGDCELAQLEELLNLFYLYIERPRKNTKAFQIWKENKKESLEGKGVRSSSEFYMDEIRALLYPQIPRLNIQNLDELSMNRIIEVYDKWFGNISGYTFVITGDFEKQQLATQLANKLSAFEVSKDKMVSAGSSPEYPIKKMEKVIRKDKINQAYARLYFPVVVPKDIKTQAVLEVLSQALSERIWNRLRAGCFVPAAEGDWMDFKNGIFAFWVRFDSELGNEERMLSYAMEEFRKLRDFGIEKKWLEKTLKGKKTTFENRLDTFGYSNFWRGYLQEKLINGEDPQLMILQYGALLEHFISVNDVNAAAKKYLSEENFQRFFVLPKRYDQEEL